MNKKIILTFDYEVFFKKTGDYKKCIIEPTNRLIDIFKRYDIMGVFFVDTLYLQRLLSENDKTKQEAEDIIVQLKELVKIGSRIELHLHPHWLDAIYDEKQGQWIFPTYEHYRMGSLTEEQIDKVVTEGVELLNSIGRSVDKNYAVRTFRAGGYCIEPFEKLKKAFKKNNIYIDSSVAYGMSGASSTHNYDFTAHPDKVFYKFSQNTANQDNNGSFIEIPITTFRINLFKRLKEIFIFRLNLEKFKRHSDGYGLSDSGNSLLGKLIHLFSQYRYYSMYELEALESPERYMKRIKKGKNSVICIIAHPKALHNNAYKILEKLAKNYRFFDFSDIKE